MPLQRPDSKTFGKTVEKLSGQRDLRHQDQCLLAASQNFGDSLKIDFGFAGAGDAVEEADGECIGVDGGVYVGEGGLLVGGES